VWIKLDDNIIDHPKLYAAARHVGRDGLARAFCVYVAGLSFSNRHLTDGFIPFGAVSSMKLDRKPTEIAEILSFSDVRLWEKVPGGYQIHDYHDVNPTSQEIKDKRARDRERKRHDRESKGGRNPAGVRAESSALARARSGSGSDPVPGRSRSKQTGPLRVPDRSSCGKPVENSKEAA
jgi:hypothetical protein